MTTITRHVRPTPRPRLESVAGQRGSARVRENRTCVETSERVGTQTRLRLRRNERGACAVHDVSMRARTARKKIVMFQHPLKSGGIALIRAPPRTRYRLKRVLRGRDVGRSPRHSRAYRVPPRRTDRVHHYVISLQRRRAGAGTERFWNFDVRARGFFLDRAPPHRYPFNPGPCSSPRFLGHRGRRGRAQSFRDRGCSTAVRLHARCRRRSSNGFSSRVLPSVAQRLRFSTCSVRP